MNDILSVIIINIYWKYRNNVASFMTGERIFTRDFILDTLISLCCSLNYFALLINITGYAEYAFGASPAVGGTAAGIYVIGGLISRVLIGKYVELIGRKRLLIIGLAFALVMSGAYFFVSSLTMLFAVRFLHGISFGISSTCTGDIIAKLVPPSRRGEGMGYYAMAFTISCAIGPILGMSLGQAKNYDGVFTIGLIMYALALIMAFMIHVPEERLSENHVKEAKGFSLSNMFQLSALPLAITVMVFYFSYSGVLSFISSYAEEIDMVTAATYFYLAIAIGTLFSRLFAGKIYDERGPNIVVYPAYILFAIGMVIFATTSSPAMFLGCGFIIGFGVSIVFSICQSIVIARSPPRRYGVTTSTFSAVNDLGTGIGPTILGILITTVGFREMYLCCAGIAVVSLIMYWSIHGRKHGSLPGREIVQESD